MPAQETSAQPHPEKKTYHTPRFTQHGTIQNMTLGGTAGVQEGMMGTALMKQRP